MWSVLVVFSRFASLFICVWLLWRMYLQSATLFVGIIMYLPKNNCPRLLYFLLWYADRTVKAAVDRITIHGSASSTYVFCILYEHTRLPNTVCIISMIAFACGFPGESGLVLIPYSFYINLSLNSWLRNSPHRLYMISTGCGYRTSHVVSTKFAIVFSFLFLYCVTSNHPFTGSIVVTAFNIRGYFSFLSIL